MADFDELEKQHAVVITHPDTPYLTIEKYKSLVDFLMNQIVAMVSDGEEFDFLQARKELETVDLDIDDYMIY